MSSDEATMRQRAKVLELDRVKLIRALRELLQYTGGSDLPKSHPIGKACAVLIEVDSHG